MSCPSSRNPSFHGSTWCERPCFSPLWYPLDPFVSSWNKHWKIWKCPKWHFFFFFARNHRKLRNLKNLVCPLEFLFSSTPFEESQMSMIRPTFIIKRLRILWLKILGQSFRAHNTNPWENLFHLYFELPKNKNQRKGESACGCLSVSVGPDILSPWSGIPRKRERCRLEKTE